MSLGDFHDHFRIEKPDRSKDASVVVQGGSYDHQSQPQRDVR